MAVAGCRACLSLLAAAMILSFMAAVNGQTNPVSYTNDYTLLQYGYEANSNVITTLSPATNVDIRCKVNGSMVYDDPWWLSVDVPSVGYGGWVSDYFIECGTNGYCYAQYC